MGWMNLDREMEAEADGLTTGDPQRKTVGGCVPEGYSPPPELQTS